MRYNNIPRIPAVKKVNAENINLLRLDEIPNFLANPEQTPKIILSLRGLERGFTPTLIF
jgi:hypothetical protein